MKTTITQCNQCGKTLTPQKHNGGLDWITLLLPERKLKPDGKTFLLDRFGEYTITPKTADLCATACLRKYLETLR